MNVGPRCLGPWLFWPFDAAMNAKSRPWPFDGAHRRQPRTTPIVQSENSAPKLQSAAASSLVWPGMPPADGLPLEVLYAHTSASFAAAVESRLGRGGVLAKALYREFFACGGDLERACSRTKEIAAARALGAALVGLCDASIPLSLAAPSAGAPVPGQTEKYVLRTRPGGGEAALGTKGGPRPGFSYADAALEVEMVAMPAPGRTDQSSSTKPRGQQSGVAVRVAGPRAGWSLCVSSQVGCQYGCAFCETGRLGLLRSLSAGEIVAQLALARHVLGLRVLNVVFMGMGEPLDNLEAVVQAVRVMSDPLGFAISLCHITISTSGEAPAVPRLLRALPRARLAFSLHSADDATRSRLMPVNRRVPLSELADAMRAYVQATKHRVTVQYILLAGVNDSVQHAADLAAFLGAVAPVERLHLNLIPYNAQSRPSFAASCALPRTGAGLLRRKTVLAWAVAGAHPSFPLRTEEACKAFKTVLTGAGLFVKIRWTRGADKMAACGQLGNVKLRREVRRVRAAAATMEEADWLDEGPAGSDDAERETAAEEGVGGGAELADATIAAAVQRLVTLETPRCSETDLSW